MYSPELDLILILTGNIYREPNIPSPQGINWDLFLRIASENKVLYYTVTKLLDSDFLTPGSEIFKLLARLKKLGERSLLKLRKTLEVTNSVLGEDSYLLLKTYKAYPYITSDVDILVRDMSKAKELLRRNGLRLLEKSVERHKLDLGKEGLLEIELHDSVSWGPLVFIDNEVLWSGSRRVSMGGVEIPLPSLEGDILTVLAHINFQNYEIILGDLLYLFKTLPEANLNVLANEARKFDWFKSFYNTMAILSGLHKEIYKESCTSHGRLPPPAQVKLDLPYTLSFRRVVEALTEKGLINLVKLPSYYSTKLRKYMKLHRAYDRLVLEHLAKIVSRYVYY